jgi:cytidylate kinase
MVDSQARVITIDGPSGSGKGTLARRIAERLGWRLLDSGALYRLVGHAVAKAGIAFDDEARIADLAGALNVKFEGERIYLDEEDVSDAIRTESVGSYASRVAALPKVRAALLEWQRACARAPGLVADGRDMGTVVFPRAEFKVFLEASPDERARRRYNQLIEKGFDANLQAISAEVRARDERDRSRSVAPLRPAAGALIVDSTRLAIEEVLEQVMVAAARALAKARRK